MTAKFCFCNDKIHQQGSGQDELAYRASQYFISNAISLKGYICLYDMILLSRNLIIDTQYFLNKSLDFDSTELNSLAGLVKEG